MSSKKTTWVVCLVVDLSVLFSALFWEMIQFDYMFFFSDGLKPPTVWMEESFYILHPTFGSLLRVNIELWH